MYKTSPVSTGSVFHANNITGTHGHSELFCTVTPPCRSTKICSDSTQVYLEQKWCILGRYIVVFHIAISYDIFLSGAGGQATQTVTGGDVQSVDADLQNL